MPDVMKTLLLNPPSFENFDGGASSRWPATREIESYWYPVWLTYPAGMIPGSRLLDASPHKVNWQQTVQICKDYEFLILFTSTVGFESDIRLIRKIKESNPGMKIAFVGPHERNLHARVGFFDLADEPDVALEANRGSEENQKLIVLANLNGLLPIDFVGRSIEQPAAGNHPGRIRQPNWIPIRLNLTRRGPP